METMERVYFMENVDNPHKYTSIINIYDYSLKLDINASTWNCLLLPNRVLITP